MADSGLYYTPLFCSKYLIAEAFFQLHEDDLKKSGKTVVCASTGNLALAMGFLAQKTSIPILLYLPVHVPTRIMELMNLLGIEYRIVDSSDLTNVNQKAELFTKNHQGFHFFDQLDLQWCARTYNIVRNNYFS